MRRSGYRQVSLTPEAHRALKQLKFAFSDTMGEEVTLSQAVLMAQLCYTRHVDDRQAVKIGQEVGIEPPTEGAADAD